MVRANIIREAEIQEFFEEEKLETTGPDRKEPCLTPAEINDLPVVLFQVTENQKNESVTVQCAVCQTEFEHAEKVRTLRCLHIFHTECIDNWLMNQMGSCPICKVKQRRQKTLVEQLNR